MLLSECDIQNKYWLFLKYITTKKGVFTIPRRDPVLVRKSLMLFGMLRYMNVHIKCISNINIYLFINTFMWKSIEYVIILLSKQEYWC